MPKFAPSRYSDQALPGLVRDVCRHARPNAPVETTEREFNDARAAAGHPDAPTAGRICTRLHITWPELKSTALNPKRSHTQTVAARTRPEDAPWIGEDACVFALQLVAKRRGVDQLSPSEYEETADVMRREHARRWAHGNTVVLPTVGQIERCFKTWAKALKAAGLSPRRAVRMQALGYVDALELALETKGAIPTSHELERFVRVVCRLSFGRPVSEGLTHLSALGELRRRRTAAGKWTPSGSPPKRSRPDWDEPVEGLMGERRVGPLTEELCVQFLMRFLLESPRDSQKAYVVWASRTEGAPSSASMRRSGRRGFSALRAETRERLRKGERPVV